MKVLAICGSMRGDSSTRRALEVALRGAAEAGAEVALLSVRELDLPFCDGREGPYGPSVERWRAEVAGADGLVVGSPEYHGSLAGVLKNALDLLPEGALRGHAVGMLATARRDAGAMNTLAHTGHVCRWLGAIVIETQVGIPRSQEAFGPDGAVLREGLEEDLVRLGREVARYARLLRGA